MKVLGSLVLLVFISACGGGSGTASSTPPSSTPSSSSTPTTDPASRFEDSKFGSSTFN